MMPALYENHGIDARYTGPHAVAPTMSARYGTGGNNVPLIAQETAPSQEPAHAMFSRQRVDVFREDAVASTQSARQHKDATDLVMDVAGLDCRNGWENGDLCGTLQQGTTGSSLNSIHPVRTGQFIRRLTPLECERLQGFPDHWTDLPGASDSARYKALGNSVAIPCVDFVLRGDRLVFKAEQRSLIYDWEFMRCFIACASFSRNLLLVLVMAIVHAFRYTWPCKSRKERNTMENLKNLCGQIPEALHKRVLEDKGPDVTNGDYLTKVLTEYFARIDGQTGNRTLGCQISEELHQRLEQHLKTHRKDGKKLSQKAFVLGLIEDELDRWDAGETTEFHKDVTSSGKGRPLAYGVSAELFQRIEQYLDVHKGLSKKGLVAGLILRELDAQEVLNPDDSPEEHPDAPKETEDMDIQADESAGAGSDSLLEDEEPEETAEGSSGEDDAE